MSQTQSLCIPGGEFHSEAAWANIPAPGNLPSPPSLLWGWEQPSLVLAFAEITLATHTVSWAGTGGLPPAPAFSLLRSAREQVFPQMSPERPDPGVQVVSPVGTSQLLPQRPLSSLVNADVEQIRSQTGRAGLRGGRDGSGMSAATGRGPRDSDGEGGDGLTGKD